MGGLEKFNRAIEKSLLLLEIPIIKFLVICLLVIYNTLFLSHHLTTWFLNGLDGFGLNYFIY